MRAGKNAKRSVIIVLFVVILFAGAAVAGYLAMDKLIVTNLKTQINELKNTVDTNTHNVFVANQDIKMGDEITMDMLRVETQLLANYAGIFTDESLGTKALVDIPKDAVMFAAYSSGRSDESTSRMVEYTCLYLSATLNKGDYVDVRIRYQNGEDFSVLAKKQIEEISIAAKSCHLVVNAEELQKMSSAIIDANEYNAVLYCVKYTAPSIQEPTEITYIPRPEILSVLYKNGTAEYTNLMVSRGELEARLVAYNKEEQSNRAASDISNFSGEHGKEQSNTNDSGMTSMPVEGTEE